MLIPEHVKPQMSIDTSSKVHSIRHKFLLLSRPRVISYVPKPCLLHVDVWHLLSINVL